MIQIAVLGVGGWGKNLARNYSQLPDCTLRYVCDLDETKLAPWRRLGCHTTTRVDELLQDPDLQAVAIATPAPTHYPLVRAALEAGKDVFVEKPFVLHSHQAQELTEVADRRGRILMVGHLLLYHPVVTRIKQLVTSGELGDIYYVYNQRVNLGTVRGDENALWSFAPHDIAVILHLLDQEPTDVAARGQSYLQPGVEDVVFVTLNFNQRALAHIHVSWLDPHKIRKLTIVGSRKMVVFDDLESTEKLRIYDKSAEHTTDYHTFAEYITLRFGDITIPHVRVDEPLRLECQHFLDCVRHRSRPLTDGRNGLRVVRVLEAAQRSLEKNGTPVPIEVTAP
jgi:predicted dehydrogenase